MSKRNLYLSNTPVEEALEGLINYCKKEKIEVSSEWIPVPEGVGRVTANPILAETSNPPFLSSAMDGIATHSRYLKEARETSPVTLSPDQFEEIDTGDKIPDGYNCVVPAEEVTYLENNQVELIRSVTPWAHIRPVGEDIGEKELIVPQNHILTPYDLGVILNGGVTEIEVLKKPHVVLIPTGDEIISPFVPYEKGKLRDCNTTVFKGLLEEAGAVVTAFPVIEDDKELLKKNLKEALSIGDMVIINAGSSAGRDDYTVHLIKELGEVFCHGVAMRPGKPTILGAIHGKPVLGIPGFPVSAVFSLETFALAVVSYLTKIPLPTRPRAEGVLATQIPSQFGALELVRVLVGEIYDTYQIMALPRGSSSLSTLSKADALLKIPPLSQGYEKGQRVSVELLRDEAVFKKRLMIQGSHDFTIDALKNSIKGLDPSYEIAATNIGSLGGILAVMNKEAHGAGIHLLDTETHSYNISYVKKYLGDKGRLIHIAQRQQGLIVPKGNPKGIRTIKDILEKEAQYVNRQLGAGTRVLLDYLLKKEGLSKDLIEGYHDVVYTHLEVGARVASGQAEVGLGIYTAAALYDLDFIPITEESYDFCCLEEFFNTPLYDLLIQSLKTPSFIKMVESYGGYNLKDCGKILR